MADKTSVTTYGLASAQSQVVTAGSIAANTVNVLWDDATPVGEIMDQIEKQKVQIMDYYNKR